MKAVFIVLNILLISTLSLAQQKKTEVIQRHVKITSFEDLGQLERNTVTYHNALNQSYALVADQNFDLGYKLLFDALALFKDTLAIDHFFLGTSSLLANDKDLGITELERGFTKDSLTFALLQNGFFPKLLGGAFGEKKWLKFLETDRVFTKNRLDHALIQKIRELDSLDRSVYHIEQIFNDSIKVYHKNNPEVIREYELLVQMLKRTRDAAYAYVPKSEAWPMNRIENTENSSYFLQYEESERWFARSEGRLMYALYDGVILPWEYAFMHDWHAKQFGLQQKYALFLGDELSEFSVNNCEQIGMPYGVARDIRMFYKFPADFLQ